MMKKCLLYLAAGLLLAACGEKEPRPEEGSQVSVKGAWELSSVTTKTSIGSIQVNVYLDFTTDSFTLYQKIGEGRYTVYSGIYTLSENSLSGSYSGGKAWGPYTVAVSDGTLTLTSPGGEETDVYRKISLIPSSVLENTY